MGTRADFYVGRGENAEWLGSIAWDGYPSEIPSHIFDTTTESDYREAVNLDLASRNDWTTPAMGWPWPWETSNTTDYAYAFDGGKVYGSCFGYPWFDPHDEPEDHDNSQQVVFPDMSACMNVQFGGKRSGIIVISAPEGEASS